MLKVEQKKKLEACLVIGFAIFITGFVGILIPLGLKLSVEGVMELHEIIGIVMMLVGGILIMVSGLLNEEVTGE